MKILLIWALVFVALVKAKQRYSYIVHHKGSWGFFPDSCRFECLEHKYTVDLWMEPESKCPQFINEAQRKYALFHYDLEQVCSHKESVLCSYCFDDESKVGSLGHSCVYHHEASCSEYADLRDGHCQC